MIDFLSSLDNISQSWWPYIISFIITIISAIRIYAGGTYCHSTSRIDGKIVIITGGSSGIGLETAKELAERGANIILAVRNAEKAKKAIEKIKACAPQCKVVVKLVDIADMASIRDFFAQINNEYEQIDILINNAGIIFHPYKKTVDENELTLATNYLGPFLLTHLLLPLLSKSENGRVINVSALAHYNGKINLEEFNSQKHFSEREVFAQSKLALTVFTKHMASVFRRTKITFNSVSPGLVRNTGHLRNSRLESSILTKLSVFPWIWLFLKTPKQGCQSIVYLAVEPSLSNVSGCYFSDCEIKEPADAVNDQALSLALYEKTCKIVNINPEEIMKHCGLADEIKSVK